MIVNNYSQRVSTVTDTEILGFFGKYRFLSNFEKQKIATPFITNDNVYYYFSSEAAFMAAKSEDKVYRRNLEIATPAQAKRLGRDVELIHNWDEIRLDAMRYAVFMKFSLNQDLAKKLKDTGRKYLEESNNWGDKFWGRVAGVGDNNLGKILMEVRDQL